MKQTENNKMLGLNLKISLITLNNWSKYTNEKTEIRKMNLKRLNYILSLKI